MKKILLPTDFSEVANNAINYGIEIASQLKSTLLFHHIYTINKMDYVLELPDDKQPYKLNLERKMRQTFQQFAPVLAQKKLVAETVVERGGIFKLFEQVVDKNNIDLIVMGSKGASGFTKMLFGSVAAIALETAKVPLLVVPPDYTFTKLQKIVLAIDEKGATSTDLRPLQQLATAFNAKVVVINVDTDSQQLHPSKWNLNLEGVNTDFYELPVNKSVNNTINEFVEKSECDMLCMLRRERSFPESIFHKSQTQSQVYENNVPLFVLSE